jgi:hypothetical protein
MDERQQQQQQQQQQQEGRRSKSPSIHHPIHLHSQQPLSFCIELAWAAGLPLVPSWHCYCTVIARVVAYDLCTNMVVMIFLMLQTNLV